MSIKQEPSYGNFINKASYLCWLNQIELWDVLNMVGHTLTGWIYIHLIPDIQYKELYQDKPMTNTNPVNLAMKGAAALA
mgnify:CR=1 FL=1